MDDLAAMMARAALVALRPTPTRTRGGRILVVLDLNGIFIDRVRREEAKAAPPSPRPHDGVVNNSLVWRRPHVDTFLDMLFDRFDVGVWSAANKDNVRGMLNVLLRPEHDKRLVFVLDQSHCDKDGVAPNNPHKPLFIKDLAKAVWAQHPQYASGRTLLLDDTPYKARRNPPHTALHPPEWTRHAPEDAELSPQGRVRTYLEALAAHDADEPVPDFLRRNPFDAWR